MMCSPSYVLVFNVSVRSYRPLGVAIHSKCVETYGNMASLSSLHLHPGIQPSWRWSSPSRYPKSNQTDLFGWQVHIYPLSGGSLTHLTLLTQGFGLSIPYRYVWLNHFVAESTILRHVLHLSLNRTPIPNKKPSPCGYLGTIPAPKGPT